VATVGKVNVSLEETMHVASSTLDCDYALQDDCGLERKRPEVEVPLIVVIQILLVLRVSDLVNNQADNLVPQPGVIFPNDTHIPSAKQNCQGGVGRCTFRVLQVITLLYVMTDREVKRLAEYS
jgi:hypothetical protein